MIGAVREALTAAERVGRVLSGERPDRYPYFLPAPLHAAGLLGVSLRELFSSVELSVEGALAVRERLGNDLVSSFGHAADDAAAFGAEVIFFEDGPPNAGTPPFARATLGSAAPPRPDHPAIAARVEVTRRLVDRLRGRVPVSGALVGPFSLPVMQLGFPTWLDVLHESPREAERLLDVNVAHCAAWGRAMLAAGASAVLLAEPLASRQMTTPRLWRELGLPALRRFAAALGGPFGLSTASARILDVAPDLAEAGAVLVGASEDDDLDAVARATGGRAVVAGNLNGLRMRRWTAEDVDREVRALVARLPAHGRALVTEHHGELPLAVPFDVAVGVAEALRRHGGVPGTPDG
jgi:uroporphyrinogen decarboxylase